MLNVETVRCLGVEQEREIDGSVMGSEPENLSGHTPCAHMRQMFHSSPTVNRPQHGNFFKNQMCVKRAADAAHGDNTHAGLRWPL